MKDIEEIKDKQKEVNKKVLEFLKQHRGQGFTREEIAQKTGVNKGDVSSESYFCSPLKKWKIGFEYNEHKKYYYAERIHKVIRPLISGCSAGAGLGFMFLSKFPLWIRALQIVIGAILWIFGLTLILEDIEEFYLGGEE